MFTCYNNPNGLPGVIYFICSKNLYGQQNKTSMSNQLLTGSGSNGTRGGCKNTLVPGMSVADKNVITPGICYEALNLL